MKRTIRGRRGVGWVAGVTLMGLGSIFLAASPIAATTSDSSPQQLSGVLTVTVDHPGGPTVSVATPTGRVSVAGLDAELLDRGLASGDSISVTVTPNPEAANPPTLIAPFSEPPDTFAVPGTVSVLSLAGPSGVSTMATPAVHEVTLVRAVWPGPEMADAPSFATLDDATSFAGDYWRAASGDRLDFQVVDRFDNIALTKPPCLDLHAAYDEVKLRTGWRESPRAHLVVAIPNCTQNLGGQFDGWGSFGADAEVGGFVFLNGIGAFTPGTNGDTGATLAHEFGHNLSLHHSNEVICHDSGTQLINGAPGDCRGSEYGGVYSVMGSWLPGTQPALGAHQSYLMGYTDATTLTDVISNTNPQTVKLVPTAGAVPGLKFARVADSAGNSYYLEYRTRVGLDAYLLNPSLAGHLLEGVVVSKVFAATPGTEFGSGKDIADSPTQVRTRAAYMLDTDPAQNPYAADPVKEGLFEGDPVLTAGTPVALGDVSVRLLSAAADEATIEVVFPPTRPLAAVPSPPQSVTASRVGNNSALVAWTRPANGGGAHITSYTVKTNKGTYTCTTVSEMACQVDGLPLGAFYTFTVTASNELGTSSASTPSAPLAIGPIPSNSPTPSPSTSSPSATAKPTASSSATAKPTASSSASRTATVTPSASATTAAVTTPTPSSATTVNNPFTNTTTGSTYDPFATTTEGTYDPYTTTEGTYDPFAATSGVTYDPYAASPYSSTTDSYVTSTETTGTTASTTTSLATTGAEGLPGLLWAGMSSLLLGLAVLLLTRGPDQPAAAQQDGGDTT